MASAGSVEETYNNVVVTFNFKTFYLTNIENPSSPENITSKTIAYEIVGVRADGTNKLLFVYYTDGTQYRYYTYDISNLANVVSLGTQAFSPSISAASGVMNDILIDEANKIMFIAYSTGYIYKVAYNATGVRQAQSSRLISYKPFSLAYSKNRGMLFVGCASFRIVSLNIVIAIQQTLYVPVQLTYERGMSLINDTKIASAGYRYSEIDTTNATNMSITKNSSDLAGTFSIQTDDDGGYFLTNENAGNIKSYSSLMAELNSYTEADSDPIKFSLFDKKRKLLICDIKSASTANRYIGIYDVSNKSSISKVSLFGYASVSSTDYSMRLTAFAYKF